MSLTVGSPSGAFLQKNSNVFVPSFLSGPSKGVCANVSHREWLTTRSRSNFTRPASNITRIPRVRRVSGSGGLSDAGLLQFRLSGAENRFGTGRITTSPEKAARGGGDSEASTWNSFSANNDSGSQSSAQDAAGPRRGETERRRTLRIRAGAESSGNRYEFGSRGLRIGLLQIARLAGGGVGSEGASGGGNNHGSGWGGFGGGGGRGDDGEQFPSDDEDFNFFRRLLTLFRSRCKTGLYVCAASAFLTGFFVSALDLSHSAQAKSFSKPRMLVGGASGGNWGNGSNEKGAAAVQQNNDEELNKGISGAVWEVRGGKWTRFLIDLEEDRFLFDTVKRNEEEVQAYEQNFETAEARKKHKEEVKQKGKFSLPFQGRRIDRVVREAGAHFTELVKQVFLPAGFPGSVTEDYLEFTYWRLSQIVASQVSGVLTTQALLYAVGLGKGAIPTAAAVNWVLRDGIGYLSKIMLSKYGRHFDVHPKGWRLVSDLIENASYGLELLTPAFPHLFVYLAAAAGAGRSAAGLIQAATKSCFNSSFAAQRNFAEIIAKGEAQGMASKSVGIGLGILISGYVGSSGPLLVMAFGAVSALHIFFNIKSYQAVQLRTLNVYRASLVISQYLENGTVPVIKDVNAAEPIMFVHLPLIDVQQKNDQTLLSSLSPAAKEMASTVEKNVELGSSLAEVVTTKAEADALMDLYSREEFLLAKKGSRAMVVLKENASPRDMLRALVQLIYIYNYGKDRTDAFCDIEKDSSSRDGILRVTYNLMDENFDRITRALADRNWVSDGLVARPAPNRLTEGGMRITQAADVKA